MRCDNAWMTALSVALLNLKPGTGKTTSAVWLAHIFAQAGKRVPEIAYADDVVIIDAPQLEDHASIARSVLRYVDEILIPCAPSPIEINRTTPVREEISEVEAVRDRPARAAVLLNRCISRAHSTASARGALEGLGYDVLRTAVPRLEVYAESFGMPVPETGRDVWRGVAHDLIERCVPLGKVPS